MILAKVFLFRMYMLAIMISYSAVFGCVFMKKQNHNAFISNFYCSKAC